MPNQEIYLTTITSFLISASIITETVGSWFRYIGAANNEPTCGYSTHVRVATASRLFIVLAAPAIGYTVDTSSSIQQFALIGTLVFAITTLILYANKDPNYLILKAYNFINSSRIRKITNPAKTNTNNHKSTPRFQIASLLSFIFTASGIIIVNMLAAQMKEYKATIIQMSAFITMTGTVIHTFYVDPALSKTADQNPAENYQMVKNFIIGRIYGSALLSAIFLTILIKDLS